MHTKIANRSGFVVSLTRTLVLLIVSMSQTGAHASADIARQPVAVTQHYLDGSEATLACPFGARTEFSEPCTFEVREGGVRSRFQFEPLDLGYSFVFRDFWVFGSMKKGDLQLSLDVQCIDSDLSLIFTDSKLENSTCKLAFHVVGGKFLAEHVEIAAESNGKFTVRQRELRGKYEKGGSMKK
jgi:hypothetical protein